MTEGFNMGRKCPWSKDYIQNLYKKLDAYCKLATLYALKTEGQKVAMETMAAYNMFKCPVIYIFIHYHYGKFEDLGMKKSDIQSYMMYMLMVKELTNGMIEGMSTQSVFDFDRENELYPALLSVCKEVIFIEVTSNSK